MNCHSYVSPSVMMRYTDTSNLIFKVKASIAEYLPGTFTQWVADDVDHNVASLDGSGT